MKRENQKVNILPEIEITGRFQIKYKQVRLHFKEVSCGESEGAGKKG
jgi:hypothetical protein